MIVYLSQHIAFFLSKKNIIDKEQEEICAYGAEIALIYLSGFFSFLIIATFLNQVFNTILFLFAYCILRGCAGGYHASSHLKCYLASLSMYMVFLWCISYLVPLLNNAVLISALFIGNILLFFTAPSQNLINPKSEKELSLNRRKLLRWILIYNLVVLALLLTELNSNVPFTRNIVFIIIYALVSVAILSLFNFIKVKLSYRNNLVE